MIAMTNQSAGPFGASIARFSSISPGVIITPMNAEGAETEGTTFQEKVQHNIT